MVDWTTLSLFAAAVLVLVITPGPNTLYIVTRSVQQGQRAGIVSCFGIAAGTLVHITAAALGISALLLASTVLFSLVQYAGAAFLCYLGIKTLLTPTRVVTSNEPVPEQTLTAIFTQAMAVNVLNPKTALFFIAFLPQFIDAAKGGIATQIMILGALLITLGACSDMAYVLVAARLGEWLRSNSRFWRIQRFCAGSVYLGIGVAAALTSRVNP
jgi:threonine/homoserine/homoserine lactone efflux protein